MKMNQDTLIGAFRLALFGIISFGLGTVFGLYLVTMQQTVILSAKIKELTTQTERLIRFEGKILAYQRDVDERFQEFNSRFNQIEFKMGISRYRSTDGMEEE